MGAKKKADTKSNSKDTGDKDDKKGGKVKGAQSIVVRHILCEKHSKKEEALAKIREDPTLNNFIAVAREYSEDKAKQGGLLGTQRKGSLQPEFENVAWGLPESKGSNLHIGEAKTEFGYHLIVVEERK
ncbi:FKBP-like protein [Daldinia caldariorum]|uniref:FKBP-like protein n=1 Tax=Daldinia caldariorum TaxID=326644 RepID=UPI002007AC81|nr:FKBP-like protein [Daldinia caldariorum]KAI1467313.1 FKBP-like protein [Daldinia caldariorum]